jgi:hypothetical protein
MKRTDSVEWLSKAIHQAVKSTRFCTDGILPNVDPGLEVTGLGKVEFPLNPTRVKKLIAKCQVAPYGKGTQTLVDKKVRNTFELDPAGFTLGVAWNEAIAEVTRQAAGKLGVPADQLEARLYKLLAYERGGFFLPHRDSEKHDRMVASLIVVLPNPFDGGALVVRHAGLTQKLKFDGAKSGTAASYGAFFADCEHEVERVTHGVRLCLAYNLVLKAKSGRAAPGTDEANDTIVKSIREWFDAAPAKPLVFALEHHYTSRGLSLDLLKGTDRKLASQIVTAAEQCDGAVHLAQVSRHLMQAANDGYYGKDSWRYRSKPRGPIEIGETYEDELDGNEWTDVNGHPQAFGQIALDASAIVSRQPLDDWKPTREEYEGYTGNAGNTLDRWYHRSAIVVWSQESHFGIIASAGPAVSLPFFLKMAAKLAKTSKKKYAEVHNDCVRCARAIISNWPERGQHDLAYFRHGPALDQFRDELLLLEDQETIALLLSKLAGRDLVLPLAKFLVKACRAFSWTSFADELKLLLSTRSKRYEEELTQRDAEWLAALCCEKSLGSEEIALARQLCKIAVSRLCDSSSSREFGYYTSDKKEATVAEKSLPLLVRALLACGDEELLEQLIAFVQKDPDRFTFEYGHVPCLKGLVPWCKKRFRSMPPQIDRWLADTRRALKAATAKKPAPPSDWARPKIATCECADCAQLDAFLADPESEIGRIRAPEGSRCHLLDQIRQYQADVEAKLERRGSPYSLVLTKTVGSFKRALARYELDRKLLSQLPSV